MRTAYKYSLLILGFILGISILFEVDVITAYTNLITQIHTLGDYGPALAFITITVTMVPIVIILIGTLGAVSDRLEIPAAPALLVCGFFVVAFLGSAGMTFTASPSPTSPQMPNKPAEVARPQMLPASPASEIDWSTQSLPDLPELDIVWWNGHTVRFAAPDHVWGPTLRASQLYPCDPLLVIAVAHSESHVYKNNVCSSAGACGTWQFMPGTFAHYNPVAGADRFDIEASAQAACIMTHTLGLDAETTEDGFVTNFAGLDGSQVWNKHEGQARYVWELWQTLSASVVAQQP